LSELEELWVTSNACDRTLSPFSYLALHISLHVNYKWPHNTLTISRPYSLYVKNRWTKIADMDISKIISLDLVNIVDIQEVFEDLMALAPNFQNLRELNIIFNGQASFVPNTTPQFLASLVSLEKFSFYPHNNLTLLSWIFGTESMFSADVSSGNLTLTRGYLYEILSSLTKLRKVSLDRIPEDYEQWSLFSAENVAVELWCGVSEEKYPLFRGKFYHGWYSPALERIESLMNVHLLYGAGGFMPVFGGFENVVRLTLEDMGASSEKLRSLIHLKV